MTISLHSGGSTNADVAFKNNQLVKVTRKFRDGYIWMDLVVVVVVPALAL
jgi:hypothetical protein